ncbi:MAG TPA: hypothetical protein VHD32_05815, partial [Candidatus Didemnitutus sp.]|nr:hypothetical protein [Candidatus Didemnitutus sp.]
MTGTAVVAQYFTYGIDTDATHYIQVNLGSSASARLQKSWADWADRPTKTMKPGFSASSQSALYSKNVYEAGTGHLLKVRQTDVSDTNVLAPTLYEYDYLGQVNRSGLSVSGGSTLSLASTDRVTDQDTIFESYSSAWWLKTTTTIYPISGSSTAVTASIKRVRLSGFTGSTQSETQLTDIEGNVADTTTTVNTGTTTVTITSTAPGMVNSQTSTVVNGLPSSATAFDGLTSSAQFDALARPWKATDSRSNVTTTAYVSGTTMVSTVTDAASNVVSTNSYDSCGRLSWTKDALGHYTRFAYNARGQVTNQWGDGSYPIAYGYDDTPGISTAYGDRTSMSTYRGAPASDSSSWPAGTVGTADVTAWKFDEASGLLYQKKDANAKIVQFDYNVRGQTATRQWARHLVSAPSTPVQTSYGYDSNTGELLTKTYNDSGETLPTTGITYSYTRLGQASTVADATGTRSFSYNSSTPWRLDYLSLPAFYNGRRLTQVYESSSSSSGGTYGSYTIGTIKGRAVGFDLGTSGTPTQDLQQFATFANSGRLAGVNSAVGAGGYQNFVYSYQSSSNLLNGYTVGLNFAVGRTYESQRDLPLSVSTVWGSSTLSRADFTYNAVRERTTAKQSGLAFADYYPSGTGYSGVYNVYQYDARGELQTSAMYRGDTPTTSPSSGDELPGRRFEYRYDSLGNRTLAGETGSISSTDDQYSTNALNQYTGKENNVVR